LAKRIITSVLRLQLHRLKCLESCSDCRRCDPKPLREDLSTSTFSTSLFQYNDVSENSLRLKRIHPELDSLLWPTAHKPSPHANRVDMTPLTCPDKATITQSQAGSGQRFPHRRELISRLGPSPNIFGFCHDLIEVFRWGSSGDVSGHGKTVTHQVHLIELQAKRWDAGALPYCFDPAVTAVAMYFE
jgi:hypothetical protein